MMPKTLKDFLHCCLIAVLLGLVIPYAWYGWPTAKSFSESSSSSTLLVQQSLNLVGSVTDLVGYAKDNKKYKDDSLYGVVNNLNQLTTTGTTTITNAGDTFKAATDLLNQGSLLASHINLDIAKAEDAAAVDNAKIDRLIDAYETLPTHLNPLLDSSKQLVDNSAETVDSLNHFVADPITGQLRDSANGFLISYAKLGDKSAIAVSDFDSKFLAPYTGKHPKINQWMSVGKAIVGISEPAYYTRGVLGK